MKWAILRASAPSRTSRNAVPAAEADLAVNREVREIFRVRSRMITALRSWLDSHDYLEVERRSRSRSTVGLLRDRSRLSITSSSRICTCGSRSSSISSACLSECTNGSMRRRDFRNEESLTSTIPSSPNWSSSVPTRISTASWKRSNRCWRT